MSRATSQLISVDAGHTACAPETLRAVAALRHDHILPLDGAAEAAAEPLATVLRDRPFTASEALQVGRQIADALACAHAAGVVHGALGADAVVLVPGSPPRALVTGFGSAAASAYVAPEQLRGEPADARADVFALGLLLFELLEGRPLLGGTRAEVQDLLLNGTEPILPRFARIAPTGVSAVVARAIRRPPTGRPTAEQLRGEIEDCLRRLGELSIKTSLGAGRPRAVRMIDDTADEVDVDEGLLPEKPERVPTPVRSGTAAAAWTSTRFAPHVMVGSAGRRVAGVPLAAGLVLSLALVALGWPLWRSVGTKAPAAPAQAEPTAARVAPAPPAPETARAESGVRPAQPEPSPVVVAALPAPTPAPAPERNLPPRITSRQPAREEVEALEGSPVEFAVRAGDKNADDRLTYTWYLDGKKAGSGARWKFVAPLAAVAPSHMVAVEVADAGGLKAPRATWTIEVGARMSSVDVREWLARLAGAWQRKDVATFRLFRIATTDAEAAAIRSQFPAFGGRVSLDNPSIRLDGRYASVSFDRTQVDWLGRAKTVREAYQLEKAPTGFVAVRGR